MQELEKNFKKDGGILTAIEIGELFDIHPTKSYGLTNNKLFAVSGDVPVIVNSSVNNGIGGYVALKPTEKANTITFSDTTTAASIFLQPMDFIGYSHVQGLYPKEYKTQWNERSLLYVTAVFKKSALQYQFDYANKFNRRLARRIEIVMPYKNQKISFEYMDQYVRELEAERVRELEAERMRELEAYLFASGLNNYQLTDNEKEILSGKVECKFKTFKIGELFEKLEISSKKVIDKRKDVSEVKSSEFDLPLVNAKHGDNGIMFYGRSSDWYIAENVIDIVQNGAVATGDVYPQPHKCSVLWDAYLLKLKDYEPTDNILFYLSSALQKSIKLKFSYDKKAVWKRVKFEEIVLPCLDDKLDFSYMDSFIEALKKIAIKDVVERKDKEINIYKAIVCN